MKKTALLFPVGQGQGDGDASTGLGSFSINDSARLVKHGAAAVGEGGGKVGHKASPRFSHGPLPDMTKAGS